MIHARSRCHEAPRGTAYPVKLPRVTGLTSLHNNAHLQPGSLHSAKLPQDAMKDSLDYNSLESTSVLSTQAYFYFRWDQERLSSALVRSGGLKSEKMLFKKQTPAPR